MVTGVRGAGSRQSCRCHLVLAAAGCGRDVFLLIRMSGLVNTSGVRAVVVELVHQVVVVVLLRVMLHHQGRRRRGSRRRRSCA